MSKEKDKEPAGNACVGQRGELGASTCASDQCCCEGRRSFIKGVGVASLALGLVTYGVPDALARQIYGPTTAGLPRAGDMLASGSTANALTVDDIPENKDPLLAYPFDPKTGEVRSGNRFNGVLLEKFKKSNVDSEMAKLAAGVVLAYSSICVHQGCTISTYQPPTKTYFCACHFSRYYPLQDGAVASGPAPRPLPNLPIKLGTDGKTIVVAGFFDAPIGPIRG